ncbi:MAG: diaminopimelate epimerase [Armatimonadota bacterium]
MQFTKLHGLGNDYIYIDAMENDLDDYDLSRLTAVLSDRHFGIGGDGVILIDEADEVDFSMRIFNADGSEAEMCGNGIRAFAKYLYEHHKTTKTELEVETLAGIIRPEMTVEDGEVTHVRVDMGPPRLKREDIPMAGEPQDEPVIGEMLTVDDRDFEITCVSMGNPHCVIFVPAITDMLVYTYGPQIEVHPAFPARTNVEFVQIVDTHAAQMRVWERGAGETMACGTGASASAVAAILNGHCSDHVVMRLRGGYLSIEWQEGESVFLTGPATEVFSGQVHPSLLQKARSED